MVLKEIILINGFLNALLKEDIWMIDIIRLLNICLLKCLKTFLNKTLVY